MSKSKAVTTAIEQFLSRKGGEKCPYELASDLIEPQTDELPVDDVAINTKRLLRERFSRKGKRPAQDMTLPWRAEPGKKR